MRSVRMVQQQRQLHHSENFLRPDFLRSRCDCLDRRQCSSRHALLLVVVVVSCVGWLSPLAAAEAGTLTERLAREGVASLAAAAEQSGDPRKGAVVFHTQHLTCTKCHAAGTGPSPLGPNLAEVRGEGAGPQAGPSAEKGAAASLAEHVVESLLEPSKTIRPEYRPVTILTEEGQSVSGIVVRESPEGIVLRDAADPGREITIPSGDVESRSESPVSLMPAGLVNLLADRQQFLDLVKYLAEIGRGGRDRADELRPDPALVAPAAPAAYESDIDHAGFIADWNDPAKGAEAFKRGEKIYNLFCVNCHGTRSALGSLPTAPRFATSPLKAGADPYAMYRTLTNGAGQMVAQAWMVPSQKYDVIHYIREAYFRGNNPTLYASVTGDYLAALPKGSGRGPAPTNIERWRTHDYGPFLAASIEVGDDGTNVARKGLAVRLDAGPGGITRGRAWILYELDTLRAAAVWTGSGFIDWHGINFDGLHGRHPRIDGQLIASTPTLPGWADPQSGSFDDPRPLGRDGQPYGPLPASGGKFQSLHHTGDRVVLEYTVGDTRVLETARLEQASADAVDPVVTRIWRIEPHAGELAVRVAKVQAGDAKVDAAIVGAMPAADARLEKSDGFHVLTLPPRTTPLVVGVALTAAGREPIAERTSKLPPLDDPASLIEQPAHNNWNTVVETAVVRAADAGPFAADVLKPPAWNPWNAQVRFSGIDFLGDDSAALCTWDGDVWTVRGLAAADGKLSWRRIASGLYQPLGLKVIDGAIHVGCRDRIAMLRDLDGDGCTDRYDTFNSDHQVTEHFHEFAMGLETDAEGNLYYAKSARHALPAVVPHHGTLLKVARDGSTTEIVANGFRAANGVCVEPDGTFFVTDQEGHWNPKNRINHVRRGGFYGNMFGYHHVTDSSDAAMEPPLAWITNAFDRSPAEMLRVPAHTWPALEGRLLELSYGEGRIHLVLPQQVSTSQGTGAPLLQGGLVQLPLADLPTGIMRGRFSPADGQLYACGLFAWAGNRTQPGGFFRIRRTTAPLRMPLELEATATGLRLTFSDPLDRTRAADPENWTYTSWRLERTARYGSDHIDERRHRVESMEVSSDGRIVTIGIENFAATMGYELAWDVVAADGGDVRGRIHGTVHATP